MRKYELGASRERACTEVNGKYRSKRPYELASGGERMKMRLSSALAEKSNLVLLDEPTNHLDSDSLEELIRLIKNEESTYIIVSHDRYFIDEVADIVFEIEYGKLSVYKGNYTDYRQKKDRDREIQLNQYEQQQRKIAQVEGQIEELRKLVDKSACGIEKKGRRSDGR